ncbi:heterodisulfide reductase-related iron-sulfur binding cluster [Deinococcus aluminii]|uniref:4Fe-4S ferredoxin-type domain-containing protein n=1 Tax=Deinococcus aluminii TaxID=1656885 RepID=A0ABP9XB50_9DEIO
MLPLTHKILFFLFALVVGIFGAWGFYRLFLRIRRGAPASEVRWNEMGSRLWYAIRTSLTQERTFRRRPVISVLHAFIFYGFVYYIAVNLVDGLEGYFPFRILSTNPLGALYNILADLLSFLVLVGVIGLVIRRLWTPSKRDFRFTEKTLLHPLVMDRYILRDSLIVSAFITFHVGSRILGQGAKMVQEAREFGHYDAFQPVSSAIGGTLFGGLSDQALEGWRIFGFWGALGSVLAFFLYFPYTKHIHIFMTPINYALKRPVGTGILPPMKGLEEAMEAEEPKLGVEKLEDLEWPRLLDAYACIQCNRCQDVCPANATGKALSPAALEINKRMELNVIAAHPSPFTLRPAPFETGASPAQPLLDRPLLEWAINEESVWACTTCGACMHVCPVQDEQMLDIIDIRRHQVMVAGEFPPQLQTAFRGMERASNPWGISRDKRMEWAEGLKVPTIDENPEPDVLYWVGCAASYDPGAQKVARSFVQLLDKAGVSYAVLGKKEACTGDSARRAGNEFLYQTLAAENVETLNSVRPKLIVATCPHCMNMIGNEYKQIGGHYRTIHHTEYLETLVAAGKLPLAQLQDDVTYHDPCYLGRHNGVYGAPRALITQMAGEVLELERSRENSFCCGAGGAQFWKEEEEGRERVSDNRFREIQARLDTAAEQVAEYERSGKVLAVGCPFCKSMMNSTPEKAKRDDIVVKDVAELMLESVQRATGEWVAPALLPEPNALEESDQPVVPNAAVPMDRTGATPAAGSPVTGVTNADVINAQPGSPVNNPNTDPERQAAYPEDFNGTPPRKTWEAEAEAASATVPAEAAPARKAWKPKASADDVGAAPVTEAVSGQRSAVSEPVVAESAPTRKAWKPKGSIDDVQAAPVTEAVSEPGAAEPAPARKAWKPKASADDVSAAPVTEAASEVVIAEAAPARKAWKPKAQAAESGASSQEQATAQVPAQPEPEPTAPAGGRKKWAPKAASPSAEAAPPPGVPVGEATPAEATPAPASGERPRWQPRAKAEAAPTSEPAAAAPLTEQAPVAEEGQPANPEPGEGGRKKWVPRKKD